ncbi:MAG: DUF2752 domain-containing protein [Planctomycetota bacterium]|jgi:hypothetical protein
MANLGTQAAEPMTQGRRLRWLALTAIAGAALFLLWWVDPRQVAVPLCWFHRMTGLHCPGCGATRATHELLHGRLSSALRDNALWVFSLPLVLYAVASETRRRVWGRTLWGDPLRNPQFLALIAAAALVFGVLRNIPCAPFNLLIPHAGGPG